MANYKLNHKGSSFVAWDQYSSLEEAINATKNKSKHKDKIVKIIEDRIGGYKGYYKNGVEVYGESF